MRTRRLLLSLAVFLVLLVPLLLWQAIESTGPEAEPESAGDGAAHSRTALDPGSPPASGSSGAARPAGSPSRATLPLGEARSGGPLVRLTIRAVDASTGAPVGGARVRAAPVGQLSGIEFERDPEAALASDAVEAVTSSSGEAFLELARGRVLVAVRSEERFGFATIEAQAREPVLVALHREGTLTVRTRDRSGHPAAGVPIAIRSLSPSEGARNLWSGRTDERGIAVVRHLPVRLGSPQPEDLAVFLAFPTREPVSARFEAGDPDARVELVLPPCGAFEVLVRDPDGSPASRAWARLARAEKDLAGEPLPAAAFQPPAPVEGGRILYPFVETGLALLVRVESKAGWRPVQAHGEGPREPGALARLELAFQDAWPAVRGRLVDEHGSPLSDRSLRLRLFGGEGEARSQAWAGGATSAADGAFRVVIDRAIAAQAGELELSVEDRHGSPAATARAPTPGVLEGEVDLGTVVAKGIPILVAGVVVDDRGAPVEGAEVRIEREVRSAAPGIARLDLEPDLAAYSGADGRFELRGAAPAGKGRIHARHPEYAQSEKRALTPGDRDLELVLPRGAAIEGELWLDRDLELGMLELEAVPKSASDDPGARSQATLRIDRTFRFESLRPGTWTVTVRFRGDRVPLAAAPAVTVAAGETARIEAIELRGALKVARIEVFEPSGERAGSGWVRVRSPDGGSPVSSHAIAAGVALVPLRAPAVDLEIEVPGCRRTVLEEVREDQIVRLHRGVVLTLQLARGAELPPPYRWAATLSDQPPHGTPVDPASPGTPRAPSRDSVTSTVSLRSDGSARFVLREGGQWWIRLQIRDDSRPGRVETIPCSPAQVDLPEAGGDAALVVAPLAGEVERALEALR